MGRYKPSVIHPWSLGPCPSAAELSAAWANRLASQSAFIALLSVLGELTCHVDCHLRQLGGFGNIAGRVGGLKAWLFREAPELAGRYKSVSRHATLATRLKRALNLYPPAPLSLLHPDLPKPPVLRQHLPHMEHFALTQRERYLQRVAPTYVAFKALADELIAAGNARHPWGRALPKEKWKAQEERWLHVYVRPQAQKAIVAEDEFFGYSRTHNFLLADDYPPSHFHFLFFRKKH